MFNFNFKFGAMFNLNFKFGGMFNFNFKFGGIFKLGRGWVVTDSPHGTWRPH